MTLLKVGGGRGEGPEQGRRRREGDGACANTKARGRLGEGRRAVRVALRGVATEGDSLNRQPPTSCALHQRRSCRGLPHAWAVMTAIVAGKNKCLGPPPPSASPTGWLAAQVCPRGGGPVREPRARPHPKLLAVWRDCSAERAAHCTEVSRVSATRCRAGPPARYCMHPQEGEVGWGSSRQSKGLLHAQQLAAVGKAPAEDLSEPQPRPISPNLIHGRGAARQLLRCTRCPWAQPCIW